MSHFCLLSDPGAYAPDDWDIVKAPEARAYWLDLFEKHFGDTLSHAAHRYGRKAAKAMEAAAAQFTGEIARLREYPAALPDARLSVAALCRLREKALRDHGLDDPFGHIKDRENVAASELYPRIVHDLHVMAGADKWLHLVKGVFAGNIFDLGSPATMHLAEESPDFLAAVERVSPRPWLIDDFDRLVEDLPDQPPPKWSRAIVFADNAGSDLILGLMPLVRELALMGTQIVLAANELPSLNDITADETVKVVERLAALDTDLAALIQGGMIEVVSTGNDIPLIDLSDVSDELNDAAEDADFVIIEGMGRAVESNLHAAFKADCLKIALLKDPEVARSVGGEVFDCVCRYEPV